jgi:hypothetical protein
VLGEPLGPGRPDVVELEHLEQARPGHPHHDGGFGDGVLDALNRAGIHVPLHKIALLEGFVHHGGVEDLRRLQRIDVSGMLEQVREALATVAAPRPRRRSKVAAAS